MRHIERQNDFWTKNANNRFFIKNLKILDRMTDVHLSTVKLESGVQQFTSYKEKSLGRK